MPTLHSIGITIKIRRGELGLSQDALSKKAGVNYNTLLKIESGASKDPRVGTLARIAEALNATIDQLMRYRG